MVPRRMIAALLVVGALGGGTVVAAPAARAGTWIQVSCVNPDGSAAPSENWSGAASGAVSPLSSTTTACTTSSPMRAFLSNGLAVAPNAAENLQYTPPEGSTLIGGTLRVALSADGSGAYGKAVAAVEEPGDDLSAGDGVFACVYAGGCGTDGSASSAPDYTGTVTLPANREGDLYVSAICQALSNSNCDAGGSGGAYASAAVSSADLVLADDAVPTATGISGSALGARVAGTAGVLFTASDPGGPGVYSVSVALDGANVSGGQPSANGGACVPVGTGSGGALMFDESQPCPASVAVDEPVPTTEVKNGLHRLTVTVTDAAGNTATVVDRTIRVDNGQLTPRPRRGLRTQFAVDWHWDGPHTRLGWMRAIHLPRAARVTVSCRGRGCPRLRPRTEPARLIRRLLEAMRNRRFRAGDRLLITVSERHHRAERIEVTIRSGRRPVSRLLGGSRRRR